MRLNMPQFAPFPDDFTPLKIPRLTQHTSVAHSNPPYNGWGSEEDSLANCHSLIPVPPQRDFVKFMAKDRFGYESHVLRFAAKMITDKALDQSRRFIISFYLADDTILVYEPPVKNSGKPESVGLIFLFD
ncbi:unnamed protein product [Protopolystoma xenopodis]|uniref:DM10 domain-containing protein n=1 Tax=Protopolystoma xenopodis TaxID=117903 RepID=A0A3S5C1E5_9PLAT|nr:unnamed protein product [Protopolystoma xenopodis]